MYNAGKSIAERLQKLEAHLERENSVLLNTVKSFRELDKVAYKLGLLNKSESFATKIPWWPLVSILGTFSAGKSSFINSYLGAKIQRSGNQAVDDKFTVISYSPEAHTLPGVALDADPRFPFYQISNDIEHVATGEGQRIDTYLQLKTYPSPNLVGKVLIDSPGFDADAQRNSTLRITDHIIDISDLVLVFFDARHPESGAMRDTLQHLVGNTINRPDASKFLYILNQLDTCAREDNPEDVVAAWHRALAEQGLTAGRFFTIYNPDVAIPFEDDNQRLRFETKRDVDLADIHERMQRVEVERAYRIIGALEKTALDIKEQIVPLLQKNMRKWRKIVLIGDSIAFGLLFCGIGALSIKLDFWSDFSFILPTLETISNSQILAIGITVFVCVAVHVMVRKLGTKLVTRQLARTENPFRGDINQAFLKNTRPWRSIFSTTPVGWGLRTRNRITMVLNNIESYIQTLNDRFTNPDGDANQTTGSPQPE